MSKIVTRYISTQLFTSTVASCFVLALIFIGGRLITFLNYAAEGRLDHTAIFIVLFYRTPGFLQLILPMALFLGILLSYGRLYLDSEMTVLQAAGISQWKITQFTILPILIMTFVVAIFSLYITPWGSAKYEELLYHAKANSQFDILVPGKFHVNHKLGRVTYVEDILKSSKDMERLFFAEEHENHQIHVTAARGIKLIDSETGIEYLQLQDGYRYQGLPGQANYQITKFNTYTIKVSEPEIAKDEMEIQTMSTLDLIKERSPFARAELQWRLSIPIIVPIVALIAIPLAKVNARQGQYLKMLPAIIGYLSYLSLLITCKSWIEEEKAIALLGMWWVHLLFLTIAVILHNAQKLRRIQRMVS